jgi:ABC-type multidrug transport system fused ATPase/permease subunit
MTGIDLQTENIAKLIQLALGPVFLLSGVGITLSMLTQRLSRIVDRARTLEDQRERTTEADRLKRIDKDLRAIWRRTKYINSAIAMSTISALLTTLVVTILFASEFTPIAAGLIVAVLFSAAMICLSIAFLLFLIEVRIAINTLRIGEHRY